MSMQPVTHEALLDAYSLLEVPTTACPEEVAYAYRRLMAYYSAMDDGTPEVTEYVEEKQSALGSAVALIRDAPLRDLVGAPVLARRS